MLRPRRRERRGLRALLLLRVREALRGELLALKRLLAALALIGHCQLLLLLLLLLISPKDEPLLRHR